MFKVISHGNLAVAAMSDDPVREWILSEGKATQITRISPIGGGCINRASRYDTDAGSFFVKTNRFGCMVLLMLKWLYLIFKIKVIPKLFLIFGDIGYITYAV